MKSLSDILSEIQKFTQKPPLFEPGEARFWDDPHISKGMLAAHLNPDNDAASRKHATIDKEVNNLLATGVLKPGDKLLDLGCGPGLYAVRLAQAGIRVTGIDISERSLNYAVAQSKEKGCDIDYRRVNFFDIDYINVFDAVIQTNGELNVFSDEKRDLLLEKLHIALKPGGLLVFDVTTRELRKKYGLKNRWYVSDGGFWRPGKHLVLEHGFDYPEQDIFLDQYIVFYDDGVTVYRNWFHDYSLESLTRFLNNAGFKIAHTWNDLTGKPYKKGGEWIAVVAQRG